MVRAWARAALACSLGGRHGSGAGTRCPTTTPITFAEDETFDVGEDTRTRVAMIEYRYDSPFKFTGTIDKLTVKLEPEPKSASKP
jgi:hypothetical protein